MANMQLEMTGSTSGCFGGPDLSGRPPRALPEDSSLIAKALAGDGAAFESLVRPHLRLFTSAIHRILQDDRDTQHALEGALVSIHAELPNAATRCKFPTWAYRVCINEALMLRRSRLRPREVDVEEFLPWLTR